MDKMNFIKTSNETTALLLKQQGFTCVNKDVNGIYTFINDAKMKFDVDPKNIVYTNTLSI